MEKIKAILKKPITSILIIVVIAGSVIVQKIRYYSADPVGDKDCPPANPEQTDGTKANELALAYPPTENLNWLQKGGSVNDASCLNKTAVYGVVQVQSEDDVKKALAFAQHSGIKISPAGVKHSMGGQAFSQGGMVLDMRQFNRVVLNEQKKTITVQSGATWHDIQNILHPKYAVKSMQSTDIFTVGGSISVNAHGMDHNSGSVARTIRSMRVMAPDGTISELSKTKNAEHFNLVIGGYGLFGIILDVELDITENTIYESERRIISYKEFPDLFNKEIQDDAKYGLMYSHLSTAKQSFLDEMILYTYKASDDQTGNIPALAEVTNTKLRRFVINLSKKGSLAMRLKWFTEKYVEPKIESCSVTRNQAMKDGEACLVSRNEPMHDSVKYLQNNLKNDTDILHEYFIPRGKFAEYVDGVREILTKNNTNLLNASVRVVHKEDNYLSYAPEDMFALVLYINQKTDDRGNAAMSKVTGELVDLTNKVGGKFFLPYQLYYSDDQLKASYPQINEFFRLKRKYDPTELLTNTFYQKYSKVQ